MKTIITAIKVLIAMTLITGVAYPLLITGFAQVCYSNKANGSMIIKNNQVLGSELIGQSFSSPEFFWGRPSAIGNNPMPSGGSNLSPVGELFKTQFQARLDTIRKYHGNIELSQIPKDLLFASGSGVDPHIAPETAYFQVERIAMARNYNQAQKEKLKDLIKKSIESRDFFIFGEERVNVLKLNLELSGI